MAWSHFSGYQEEDGSGNKGQPISHQFSPKHLAQEGKWLSTCRGMKIKSQWGNIKQFDRPTRIWRIILSSCLARFTSASHSQSTLCKIPTTRSVNHLKKPQPPVQAIYVSGGLVLSFHPRQTGSCCVGPHISIPHWSTGLRWLLPRCAFFFI